MGTRADYYIKRGDTLEWLASTAWDGYPETKELTGGVPKSLLQTKTLDGFMSEIRTYFSDRDDVTLAKDGWRWPWTNSKTTDYTYIFDEDNKRVLIGCFSDVVVPLDAYEKHYAYLEEQEKRNENLPEEEQVWELEDFDEWLEKTGYKTERVNYPEMEIIKENIFGGGSDKSGIIQI